MAGSFVKTMKEGYIVHRVHAENECVIGAAEPCGGVQSLQ